MSPSPYAGRTPDHGFNCDQRSAYDEASALQARDRTLAFFDQQLA